MRCGADSLPWISGVPSWSTKRPFRHEALSRSEPALIFSLHIIVISTFGFLSQRFGL